MSNPEDAVVAFIDQLEAEEIDAVIDWQMTESPAAKAEGVGAGRLLDELRTRQELYGWSHSYIGSCPAPPEARDYLARWARWREVERRVPQDTEVVMGPLEPGLDYYYLAGPVTFDEPEDIRSPGRMPTYTLRWTSREEELRNLVHCHLTCTHPDGRCQYISIVLTAEMIADVRPCNVPWVFGGLPVGDDRMVLGVLAEELRCWIARERN